MSTHRRPLAILAAAIVLAPQILSSSQRPDRSSSFSEILEVWASHPAGNHTAAHELLRFVEQHYRSSGPAPRARGEAKLLRDLAKEVPGVFVPVIGLYSRAHLLAILSDKPSAAGQLRTATSRLIEQYMANAQNPSGWRLGSRFYLSLAASLRDTLEIDMALRMLDRALDAEPENVHALFAAAAIREKYGEYSTAARLLKRLLAVVPVPEARLRLALCLTRSGKVDAGERMLAEIARGVAPDWVRAIAYQEWSRLRMAQGDPGAALRLAREGHGQLPYDDSLAILVAFMSGPRDPMSRSLSSRLASQPTGTGPTARGQYNLWPPGIATNEAVLTREVEGRMPLLVDALQRCKGD